MPSLKFLRAIILMVMFLAGFIAPGISQASPSMPVIAPSATPEAILSPTPKPIPTPVPAATPYKWAKPAAKVEKFSIHNRLVLGLSLFSHDADRLSMKDSGATSMFSTVYFNLNAYAEIAIFNSSWYLSPLIAYSPFGLSSADQGEKSHILPLAIRLEKRFDNKEIHAGPGLLIYKVTGSGGTTTFTDEITNTTTTEGLPSDSQTSKVFLLDIGVGEDFNPTLIGAIDFYISGLASSRRAVSLAFTLSHGVF